MMISQLSREDRADIELLIFGCLTESWENTCDEDRVFNKKAYQLMQSSRAHEQYGAYIFGVVSYKGDLSLYCKNLKEIESFEIH